jgi:formyl-CoA transferase
MDADEFYADARSDLDGPLHGIRVLDVTRVWSGPLATCVLADLGADVIRVEMPEVGDGEVPPNIPGTDLSWFRQTVHRNKRSVGLDLRTEADQEVFLRLVATADVVVENFRPGVLSGWGIGYADCAKVRPDVVFVSVSGWGQYGPRADRSAYDPVVQAASGWMALNGAPGGGPTRAPTFLADEMAGLHAAIGALAALAHRSRTGEGQHVDVSMLDSLLFGSCGLLTLAATGAPPARWGNETDFVVPSNVYRCRDGDVYIAIALNKHWRALVEFMGRPELGSAPGFRSRLERIANRDAVNGAIAEWCDTQSAADVERELAARGLVVSRVRELADVAADPHVRARGMLQRTQLHNGTEAPIVGPAAKFSRTPTRVRHGAPAPGADTATVLAEADIIDERSRACPTNTGS